MSLFGDIEHVASDVIDAPESLAKKAFESAGNAFHSEFHALMQAGGWVAKQGELFGEGVVTGAVFNPINSLSELSGAVTGVHLPKLEFSNQEEVNNSWAGRIGKIGGTAADFALTAGGVSAVAGAEATSAFTLGTAGAIDGGLLTPTGGNGTADILTSHFENGLIGGAAGAVMGGVSTKVRGMLAQRETGELATKVVSGTVAGTASSVTRTEGKAIFEHGTPAPPQALAEQMVGGAMTGLTAQIPSSISPALTDSVAGRVANSSVSAATGGAASEVTHAAHNRSLGKAGDTIAGNDRFSPQPDPLADLRLGSAQHQLYYTTFNV